jgi:hypothetical protein
MTDEEKWKQLEEMLDHYKGSSYPAIEQLISERFKIPIDKVAMYRSAGQELSGLLDKMGVKQPLEVVREAKIPPPGYYLNVLQKRLSGNAAEIFQPKTFRETRSMYGNIALQAVSALRAQAVVHVFPEVLENFCRDLEALINWDTKYLFGVKRRRAPFDFKTFHKLLNHRITDLKILFAVVDSD